MILFYFLFYWSEILNYITLFIRGREYEWGVGEKSKVEVTQDYKNLLFSVILKILLDPNFTLSEFTKVIIELVLKHSL